MAVDLEQTAIAIYWHQMENGQLVACSEIYAVYRHLYKKLADDSLDGYHFDYAQSQRPIKFIESFCHLPKVRGNPLCILDVWQKAMIESIFGFIDDSGRRQYQEVFFTVARKQGKSALAAMIALYLLILDGEAEPELYCVGVKRDQAKIIWDMCKMIINKSPDIKEFLKIRVGDIECKINGGILKPLASDSNSLDGLNSSVVFCDELHAWQDTNLYDVMVDSEAARQQPLTLITTTAGYVRAGVYDNKIDEYERIIAGYDDPEGYQDPRRLPIIYKLDNESEWTDQRNWIKANPGLGTIRSLSKLAEDVNRAKADPNKVKNLLTKFFDIPQTGIDHFLSVEELTNKNKFDPATMPVKYAIGGFDLSETTDLTAAVILYQVRGDDKFYILSKCWLPEDKYERHIETDHVPYDVWRKRGWMDVCPGNKIDYHMIVDWFTKMKQKYGLTMYRIGYDRWSAAYMVDDMARRFGKICMLPIAQGARTLSIPLQNMRAEFQKHRVIYNNDQLMKWCLANLMVTQDTNGNYNTTKNRNDTTRDDAAIALLDAFATYYQVVDRYSKLI